MKAEEDGDQLPDWHHKVCSLVNMRVTESQKKEGDGEAGGKTNEEVEEAIGSATNKLIRRRLDSIEGGTWPCPYCDKVQN